MDKKQLVVIVITSAVLINVALDFGKRSLDRYCDFHAFEKGLRMHSVENTNQCNTNRTAPLVEIVQTGIKPGSISEEEL